MIPAIAGIDHVLIAVRALDDARIGWERLGFTLSPRGRHIGRGTGNYCVMFERDYLELIGVVEPAAPIGGLGGFLEKRQGPMGVALAPISGAAKAAAALGARGLHPGVCEEVARQLELPEGTIVPRFRLAALPPEETPGISAFLCEQRTPDLVRRPEWLVHPNGAMGILGLAVLVAATAPLVAAYERLLGAGSVVVADAEVTVRCGPHRLVFATPDGFGAVLPEVALDPALGPPAIAALALASRDLDQTADHLTQWHVAYEELSDGSVLVPAREANGATLVFRHS